MHIASQNVIVLVFVSLASLTACGPSEVNYQSGQSSANADAPSEKNPWPLPLPGSTLNEVRSQLLPFHEEDCVGIGSNFDSSGAAVVCDNLFSIPADRNGFAGDGFVASTRFPDGVVFEHGLFVAPDAEGFISLISTVWWDSNADGYYEPFTGNISVAFQNVGFEDENGFPFSDINSFPVTPDPNNPGIYQTKVDSTYLPTLPTTPAIDNGYEIYIFGHGTGDTSRMLTTKNQLIDTGDQRAIGLADEIENWNFAGPFTPVIIGRY